MDPIQKLNEAFIKDYGIDVVATFDRARESSMITILESYALSQFNIRLGFLGEQNYIDFNTKEICIDAFYWAFLLAATNELTQENLRKQLIFAIKHEINHFLLRHWVKKGHKELLNIAQDAVMNDLPNLRHRQLCLTKVHPVDLALTGKFPTVEVSPDVFEKPETGELAQLFFIQGYRYGVKGASEPFKAQYFKDIPFTSDNLYDILEKLVDKQSGSNNNEDNESDSESNNPNQQSPNNKSNQNSENNQNHTSSKSNNSNEPNQSDPENQGKNSSNDNDDSKKDTKQDNKKDKNNQSKDSKSNNNKSKNPFLENYQPDVRGEIDEYQKEFLDELLKEILEDAKKLVGSLPGEYEGVLELIKKKRQISWRQLLRTAAMVGTKTELHYTTKRRSKRFPNMIPGHVTKKRGNMDIGIDTSLSISDEELQMFLNEVQFLAKNMDITIYLFDTEIQDVLKSKDLKKKKINVKGRGGTDPKDFYLELERKKSKLSVILTDGYYSVDDNLIPKNHYMILTPDYAKETRHQYENKLGKNHVAILKNI
ncbi:MAG: hypothetical protein PWQ59_426 [Thermoanaerobacterium sp.]|nr:hypothetical protein [Thermoanaerobacterium sp.]